MASGKYDIISLRDIIGLNYRINYTYGTWELRQFMCNIRVILLVKWPPLMRVGELQPQP